MTADDTLLAFESLDDQPGMEVVDRIERLRYRLHTDEPVSLTPVGTDEFLFPVDRAVSFTASELVLPTVVGVCVRDGSGEMLTEVDHLDEASVGEGTYILELSAQIKTYVVVEGPIEITSDLVQTTVDFGGASTLRVGAVSWHDRPAATVTTSSDPTSMMAAVSTLGSALKATSPERSFPSNRGHPPAIELGDSLSVPDTIQSPDTGIRLELPAEYGAVYAAAPLAYYLGADVEPGSTPRLVTDTGFEYALDDPDGLERGVERTLKQVFLLDCVTRTEGVYEIDLRERAELDRRLDFDWARLYDRPVAEQVATYLSVPYDVVEPHVPEWRLTVHVDPVPDTVEQIPFVVDDLAIVRTASESDTASVTASSQDAGTLTRTGIAAPRMDDSGLLTDDVLTRSAAESAGTEGERTSYVEPQSSSSLEQAWIGDSIPIGASKLTPEAFRNRLDRDAADGDISITIVLNDERMSEERDIVDDVYGNRDNLPFEVTVRRNLTTDELRAQLREECSFLHYIGHTEQDGFECTDGKLDTATLEDTGVESFLLNACNSYRQGLGLIEAGAIGGIVTLNDVINDGAVAVGETVARLLNAGFPLRAALTITRDESIFGGMYIVVGDGGMTVTQSPSRTPTLLEINSVGNEYDMTIRTYSTDDAGLGTVYMPHLSDNDEYFVTSGEIGTFRVSEEELLEFFQLENMPIETDDGLRWSHTVTPDEIH